MQAALALLACLVLLLSPETSAFVPNVVSGLIPSASQAHTCSTNKACSSLSSLQKIPSLSLGRASGGSLKRESRVSCMATAQSEGEGAKHLDRVTVHYVGRLDNEQVFDSSRDRNEPFKFTIGLSETLPGFERSVKGMKAGESKTARIGPKEAYGPRKMNMIFKLPAETVPKGVTLPIGSEVKLPGGGTAVVIETMPDGSFTIDANHPLAGQHLTYEIEVLDVQEPKTASASGESLIALTREQMEAEVAKLSEVSRRILLEHGTEPPFQGRTANDVSWDSKKKGVYSCALGGLPLFSSADKFDSGTGWPSFSRPIDPDHVIERIDMSHGMARVEVLCARTGAHLGHVFPDGPAPSGKRYCINACALRFEAAQGGGEEEHLTAKQEKQEVVRIRDDSGLFPK